jgi:rhodanese-related sulfurtransferase
MRWKQFLTPVPNMKAGDAKAYVNKHKAGTFTLLDVRQPAEYKKSRIPGAKLIPLPQLADRLGELDPDQPVLTY